MNHAEYLPSKSRTNTTAEIRIRLKTLNLFYHVFFQTWQRQPFASTSHKPRLECKMERLVYVVDAIRLSTTTAQAEREVP